MVGQNVYTTEEIKFLLERFIEGKDGSQISEEYYKKFAKLLSPNQLRYVRNKYGKDPKFNTAMINTNMGKKRRRSNDSGDQQIPSSSPEPRPKKQRKDGNEKTQAVVLKPTETEKPSPQPEKVNRNTIQIQSMIPLQAPLVTYPPQLSVPEATVDVTQAILSPVTASVNNLISYQPPSGRISNDYHQIPIAWDGDEQNMGNFDSLAMASIGGLPTMQPSPATPSVVLTPQTSQHRSFVNNTPRIVQQGFPMNPPYQMIVSSQPMHHPQQRMSAPPVPQYLINQQTPDMMSSMSQLSPLSLPLPATPYYSTDMQASLQPEMQPTQGPVMPNAQTLLPLSNQDLNPYLSPGVYNMSQQRPDIPLCQFQAISSNPSAKRETVSTGVNNSTCSPSLGFPSVVLTNRATTAGSIPTTASNVVSKQASGLSETRQEARGISLTAGFEPSRRPFLDNEGADPTPQPDPASDVIAALFPQLEPENNLENLDPPQTIDPKLLAEMYTVSAVSPPEGHETTGAFAKLG